MNHRDVLEAMAREDLATFIALAFPEITPEPFKPNYHIAAIAYVMERVFAREVRKQLITMPPRHLKSICVSICAVAWGLGRDPTRKFLCISHTESLAKEHHSACRRLMKSDLYRRIFPNAAISRERDTDTEFRTTAGGGRLAMATGGPLTGRGAGIIIVDDPIKAEDGQSETMRRRARSFHQNTLLSRSDDPNAPSIVYVMQRLHEDDPAGMLLDEGCEHLSLPAIAPEDENVPIASGKVHPRKARDVLHPEHMSRTALEELHRAMGGSAYAAQYLQSPTPAGGNIFKKEWLRYYEAPFKRRDSDRCILSVDAAAKTGDSNDYSVITVWITRGKDHYLIGLLRARLEFPDLVRTIREMCVTFRSSTVLVEDTSAGQQVLQTLRRRSSVPHVIGITPKGSKTDRAHGATVAFEAGNVHFPSTADYLEVLLHELLTFDRSKHDDQVDSIVQYLLWQSRGGRRRVVVAPGMVFPGEPNVMDNY